MKPTAISMSGNSRGERHIRVSYSQGRNQADYDEDVYRSLRGLSLGTPKNIARDIQSSPQAVGHALKRLAQKGRVKRYGASRQLWEAVI